MAPFIIKFLEWYESLPNLEEEEVREIVKKWAEENGVEVKSMKVFEYDGVSWDVFIVDALGRAYDLEINDKTKNVIE